ncbi:MAG TPA: helix-turn-helix domain-containing protein [Allocoleopsis sp.]
MVFGNCTLKQRSLQFIRQPEEDLQFTMFLMDRTTDAVFCVAPDAKLVYVNEAACCLVGYSREELLAMTMQDIDPNFSLNVWSKHWRIIKQKGSLYVESLHRTREGLSVPVEITVTYVEHYGKEYGCIFVRDITKRKQLEAALQKTNEVLEHRVQERTTELRNANEQLSREIAEYKRTEAELKQSLCWLHASPESSADSPNATARLEKQEVLRQWCPTNFSEQCPTDTVKLTVPQSIFPSNPKLNQIFDFIETNYHQSIALSDVARAVGYSSAYLTDLVRRQTGKTVNHWIIERRIAEARRLLLETEQTVHEIAEAVGYQNVGHFFRQFRQYHQTTPQAWRNLQRTQSSAQ